MRKRNVLNSPRLLELKNKKRKILIKRVVIFVILLGMLVGGLSYLSRIKKLNIAEINIEGNKIIDTDKVKSVVENEIAGKYFWLFPKTNILLYPKNSIKTKVGDTFKRFKNVEISLQNGVLLVSVAERAPEYTWCKKEPTIDDDQEDCYFLDGDGYIFDKAPYFSGEVYFKFYGQNDLEQGEASGSYLASGYFDNLILFKSILEDMGLKPVILHLEENNDIKMFLTKAKPTSLGPEIIFKKDSDVQKIAENLKAALDTEPLLSKFKNEYSSLEYIDLRFGNKVYYKFK